MPPQKTLTEKVDEYKRDLDTIQDGLEQLKREYDLWFAGARKRQPFELRLQVERLLKKWRTSTIQKLELTYRLNTLNSKFSAMADVWEKIIKRREVDPKALIPFGPTTAQLAAEQSRANRESEAARAPAAAASEGAASAGAAAATAARTQAAAAAVDPETRMRRLFDQYLDAKKDLGETIDTLSFARFKGQIEKQTDQIRGKTGCKDVEFGVVRKEGRVSLTAKPIKE